MVALNPTGRLSIGLADEEQRQSIYRMRHEVYALELAQHPAHESRQLRDDLDARNVYITAVVEGELCGFISITPPVPGAKNFSIDKYLDRRRLPVELDQSVFEVRLLTVAGEHRSGAAAGLLMWAALRWVEAHGGRRIIALGRREVLEMYKKVGLEPMGIEVRGGELVFELMHADVGSLRQKAMRFRDRLAKIEARVDWRLGVPFYPQAPCYHGGAFFEAIGPRFNDLHRAKRIINADVLDAWFDPSPGVLRALREHLPWLLRTSPPTGCEGMTAVAAECCGVKPANLLCGAGSSDLIFAALRAWLHPGSRVLILDPMYGEYAHVLEKVIGCRVDRFTLRRENNYELSVESLARRAANGYEMVILVNPNSPTGRFVERGGMERFLRLVPRETRVWVDETYMDYVGRDQSLSPFAAASGNVVVCKSMSKVFALSGARAAYMVGPESLIEPLRGITPPWAVSLPAQVAAVRALRDPDYYDRCYRRTHVLRESLTEELRSLGWAVIPGTANFLLCHLPAEGPTAARLVEACRERDLFIRDISSMGTQLGDRAVRLAVKDAETNRRMVEILRQAMQKTV